MSRTDHRLSLTQHFHHPLLAFVVVLDVQDALFEILPLRQNDLQLVCQAQLVTIGQVTPPSRKCFLHNFLPVRIEQLVHLVSSFKICLHVGLLPIRRFE